MNSPWVNITGWSDCDSTETDLDKDVCDDRPKAIDSASISEQAAETKRTLRKLPQALTFSSSVQHQL